MWLFHFWKACKGFHAGSDMSDMESFGFILQDPNSQVRAATWRRGRQPTATGQNFAMKWLLNQTSVDMETWESLEDQVIFWSDTWMFLKLGAPNQLFPNEKRQCFDDFGVLHVAIRPRYCVICCCGFFGNSEKRKKTRRSNVGRHWMATDHRVRLNSAQWGSDDWCKRGQFLQRKFFQKKMEKWWKVTERRISLSCAVEVFCWS